MKELATRQRADRVLVVAPAGLVRQWQREMREKFDEAFEELTSFAFRQWRSTRPVGERLSVRFPRAVISLDLAKRDEYLQDIAEAPWDLVIFDEAHKVSRHGRGEAISLRHRLASEIAPRADNILLLSATPHDGDPYAFHSLCNLVNPFLFPDAEQIDPRDVHSIMIRRGKKDILKAIDERGLITFHDKSCLQPASYDLRIGTIFREGQVIREGHLQANEQFVIEPGGMVSVLTMEELNMPEDFVATAYAINDQSRRGLF